MSTQKQRENTMKLLNTMILTAVKCRNASSKQIMQESFLVRILAACILECVSGCPLNLESVDI